MKASEAVVSVLCDFQHRQNNLYRLDLLLRWQNVAEFKASEGNCDTI